MFVVCLRARSYEYRVQSRWFQRARWARRGAIVAVLFAVGLCGCRAEGSDTALPTAAPTLSASASPSAPAEAPSPSPTASDTTADEVLAAYRGYWDAFLEANDPPDETSFGAADLRHR